MYIDKYKRGDNYYEEDGCWHETAEDFIQCGVLGFCRCGTPSDNLNYVKELLDMVDKKAYPDKTPIDLYFAYYVLTEKGLIEHGSSVPGWLTDKGEELLSDLRELYG